MPTVSFNVRRVRESKNLSQLRLAKESGVSQGLISYIEHATVSPSSKVLMKLAATLGVDVGEFFKPIPQRG